MNLKNELTSVSNWVGVAVATIGNVLPYITPDTLTAIGLAAPQVKIASTIIGVLCLAYREKPKPVPISIDTTPPIITVAPAPKDDSNAKL